MDSKSVSKEEFKDCSPWISSPQNAKDVFSLIRVKLLESTRIKEIVIDREMIAKGSC